MVLKGVLATMVVPTRWRELYGSWSSEFGSQLNGKRIKKWYGISVRMWMDDRDTYILFMWSDFHMCVYELFN